MNTLLALGVALLVLAVVVLLIATRTRKGRGFEPGLTVSLDDRTLFSKRLMLVGRPDRLVRQGSAIIPEEWKSSRRVYHGHRLQLAVYFLLIEDQFGVRTPHGFVVLGDGSRVKVENTERLRSEALDIAHQIRSHRRDRLTPIPVSQPAAKCRACGQRANCEQARV
ncbi:MAG: Dna2/Cas4 domain-containing protein [Isosphaeraceae bacterium]